MKLMGITLQLQLQASYKLEAYDGIRILESSGIDPMTELVSVFESFVMGQPSGRSILSAASWQDDTVETEACAHSIGGRLARDANAKDLAEARLRPHLYVQESIRCAVEIPTIYACVPYLQKTTELCG